MKLFQLQNYILKILCFILLLACVVQFYAFGTKALTFFNLYTFLLIALSSGYLFFNKDNKNRTSDFSFSRREVIYLVLFFLFHFVIRINETTRFSMWWDELVQLNVSNTLPFIDSSAQHIQPPLGFVLEKLTLFLFGLNDFGARSSTVFCSLLGNFLFFALLLKITRSGLIAFVFSCLLAFEPRFLTYSIDARPMGLSFLLLVFILIELVGFLENEQAGRENKNDLRLASLFVLFVLSLGMQPVLILTAMLFAAFLTRFKGIKKILLICLILYIPVHYKILVDSSWKVPVQSLEVIYSRLTHFKFNNYMMIKNMYLKYIVLLSVLISAAFAVMKVRKVKMDYSALSFFLVSTVLFFIGAVFVFSVVVDYFFAPHYALLGLVLLIFTCALAYEKIDEAVSGYFTESRKQAWLRTGFGLILLTLMPAYNLRMQQNKIHPIAHEDLRSAYNFILQNSSDRDLLITLSFPLKQWNPIETNMASEIYYNQNKQKYQKSFARVAKESETPLIDFYYKLKNREQIEKLYIIFQKAFNQVNLDMRDIHKFEGIEVRNFDHLTLFMLNSADSDFKKTWFSFLDAISQSPAVLDSWVFNFLQIERDLLTEDAENFKRDYYLFLKNIEGADNRANIDLINNFIKSEANKIFNIAL